MSPSGTLPTPRSVDLELTSRCNARCSYCYYLGNEGVGYDDMPTESWIALFEEMSRASVLRVCLGGGEALTRSDFFELVDGVVCNRMRFQLLTNGRLVTPEVARRLQATSRCESVQVSIDGSCPEVHESMRGAGSFAPAIAALNMLRAAGLQVTVRVTVHAGNVEDLPALAKLLLVDLGVPDFSTNAVSSLGTAEKYQGLMLNARQRLRAMEVLVALAAEYPGRISGTAGPLAEARMYAQMRAAAASGRPIAGHGRLVACGCVFERLAVRADGAYVPCVMLPLQVIGHAGQMPLVDAWQSQIMARMRARGQTALTEFAECAGCRYVESCTGNCPGSSSSLTGDPHQPSPESCLRRFEEALAAEGVEW